MDSSSPLLDRLKHRQWRLTPQRRAVAAVLVGNHVHLSAEEVHHAARHIVPEVSLATVYNTLSELVNMGEITEVRVGEGPLRYDPNTEVSHHHFVCTGCALILDVGVEGIERLRPTTLEAFEMVLFETEVTFRGLCPSCAKAYY